MARYRITGVAYAHPHSGLVEGTSVGDEVDLDLDDAQERSLAGAGVLERTEGDTLQPEKTKSGAESMDAPPHTAEPGVGFQEVEDKLVGEEGESSSTFQPHSVSGASVTTEPDSEPQPQEQPQEPEPEPQPQEPQQSEDPTSPQFGSPAYEPETTPE